MASPRGSLRSPINKRGSSPSNLTRSASGQAARASPLVPCTAEPAADAKLRRPPAAPSTVEADKAAEANVLAAIEEIIAKGREVAADMSFSEAANMPPAQGLRLRRKSKEIEVQAMELMSEELERVFNKFDKDGSGALDKSELSSAFAEAGRPASDELIAKTFKALDTNNDGVISLEEFKQIAWHLALAKAG